MKPNQKINLTERIFLQIFILFMSALPMTARADVAGTLNNFFGYLTGDLGKSIAAIAIVGVGFGCFALGKIPKSYVIAVVTGVGIIFGAKALLKVLTG
jgi:type IV secretory pathway VirB2 component (pilin)